MKHCAGDRGESGINPKSFIYLKSIRSAKAVLISPRFSTIHEASLLPATPLPEQNGGQPVGYTKLKREGYCSIPSLTVAENIGGNSIVNFNEFGMSDLYKFGISDPHK